jgi:hypothetical protein
MQNVRRTDTGHEFPPSREDMIEALAKLEPGFNVSGKSDDALHARLDYAQERQPGTADAAAIAARRRNAEAWKSPEQRTDAASKVDPDEAQRRMKKRNEEAWKGQDGVQLLKQLEGDDTDKERMGPVGMR